MKLYTYFRSSAAYRVRIALNLKGLDREDAYIHLREGAQRSADYLNLNPQGLLPTLVDGEFVAGQSLAILDYLEETYPAPPLLPRDAAGRARVRQLALIVGCDIHPLNNLKVLQYLGRELGLEETERNRWYAHWVIEGFTAIEALLRESAATGEFCHGNVPGLADVCLVPQVYNANRFEVDLAAYPTILRINQACLALDPFAQAAPDVQPDADQP